MSTTPTRTRVGFVEVTLIVFGVYALGVGLFMLFAPARSSTPSAPSSATITTSSTTRRSRSRKACCWRRCDECRGGCRPWRSRHCTGRCTRSATSSTHTTAQAIGSAGSRQGPGGDHGDPRYRVARRRQCGEGGWALMRVLVREPPAFRASAVARARFPRSRGRRLTRSSSKTSQIEARGQTGGGRRVRRRRHRQGGRRHRARGGGLLLTTLPKWGPKRPKDFEPAKKLWSTGASNLVAGGAACGRAPDRRRVGDLRLRLSDHRTRADGRDRTVSRAAAEGRDEMLALRGMEQTCCHR